MKIKYIISSLLPFACTISGATDAPQDILPLVHASGALTGAKSKSPEFASLRNALLPDYPAGAGMQFALVCIKYFGEDSWSLSLKFVADSPIIVLRECGWPSKKHERALEPSKVKEVPINQARAREIYEYIKSSIIESKFEDQYLYAGHGGSFFLSVNVSGFTWDAEDSKVQSSHAVGAFMNSLKKEFFKETPSTSLKGGTRAKP